jgi:hypothetical protein
VRYGDGSIFGSSGAMEDEVDISVSVLSS